MADIKKLIDRKTRKTIYPQTIAKAIYDSYGKDLQTRLDELNQNYIATSAQTLTDEQKAQARGNIGAAKSAYLGQILRNKIYKIGSFITGTGGSSCGAVTLKIRNINEYGLENYMMAFLSYNGVYNIEYHGVIKSNNESKVFVYSDPKTTGSSKQFLVFVRTANYADWTDVYIDNEHSFTRDFVDVTDTFSTLVDGLDKLWESQLEYANPPMTLGVEYRTTERYLGKPVYCKVVDFGTAPNNDAKNVSLSGMNIDEVCDAIFHYYVPRNGENGVMTCHPNFTGLLVCNDVIQIRTNADRTDTNFYVTIKYTKITD